MKRSSSNANIQLSTRSQSLKTRPALQRDWSSDFHETFSRQLPWPTAGRTCWNYTCSERLRCTDPFTSVNFLLYFKCVWIHTPWCTLWKLGDICDVSTLFLALGSFGDLTTDFQVCVPSLPAQPSRQQGSGIFKVVKKHTDFEAQHSRLHSVTHGSLRSLQPTRKSLRLRDSY